MTALARMRGWYRLHTVGRVEASRKDFTVAYRSKSKSVPWASVDRIDVGRVPTMIVERFFIDLFAGTDRRVRVDDEMDGFGEFEEVLFQKFPEIKVGFRRVYTGDPQVAEHVTLWSKRLRPS